MKKFYLMVFLALLIFANACTNKYVPEKPIGRQAPSNVPLVLTHDVSTLNPKEVVVLYFQSWKEGRYDVMYSLISEGFKQIEPSAKTLDDFKEYMNALYETATIIDIIEAAADNQNENEAQVNYKIEIENKDGTRKLFTSSYTLRKKQNGWKLIHPYGDNIDNA